MHKKIVLINTCGERNKRSSSSTSSHKVPMGPHFPLGIIYIASFIKKRLPFSSLWIFDNQLLSLKRIGKELNQIKPDLVGINCSTFKNYDKVLRLARTAKKTGAKIVIGGNYATALAREILTNRGPGSSDYCVDTVIQQNGEKAFYQYAKEESVQNIDNLVYWRDSRVIENKLRVSQLDDLSALKLDIINPEDYFREYKKRFPNSQYKRPFVICSQKGCAWRSKLNDGCIFCSLMYKKWQLRDPGDVWKEIDSLVYDYGIDYIWDVSDTILGNKGWFREFYHQFQKRKKKPAFKIQARSSDLVDENIVKMLSDLNTVQIFIGFESNDNRCLAKMKKGTTSQINEKAISLLTKYRLPVRAYFVFGAPGETKESLATTVNFAEKIHNNEKNNLIVPLFLTPLPGSIAYKLLKQKTGKKYTGKDIIDWEEIISDWVRCFCKVSKDEIMKSIEHLRQLPYDIDAYSY